MESRESSKEDMAKMGQISVIVPVYKVEPYLRRCVDSIRSQSFRNFVLVLVDDGSPDGCGAICDEYAARDSRIHVIHRENGGLSTARNSGLDWADSQWVTFVDSDDWIHPDYLQILVNGAVQTGCKVSACCMSRTEGEPLPALNSTSFSTLAAEDYFCIHRPDCVPSVAFGKLFHRSLFARLRFPAGRLHEDEFVTYRAVFEAGTIALTQGALYAYYQNPGGIMQSAWNPGRMDALDAFAGQMAFAWEHGFRRFLEDVAGSYTNTVCQYLDQADRPNRQLLRRRLRRFLSAGRQYHFLPRWPQIAWLYEVAYPCKGFWWVYFHWKGENCT